MAEEVKVSKLTQVSKNVIKFYNDIRIELKKVVWLNRQQLTRSTFTVLMSCLIVGLIIWIADAALLKISEFVFSR